MLHSLQKSNHKNANIFTHSSSKLNIVNKAFLTDELRFTIVKSLVKQRKTPECYKLNAYKNM